MHSPYRLTVEFRLPITTPPTLVRDINLMLRQGLGRLGGSITNTSLENAECIRSNDNLRRLHQAAYEQQKANYT